MCDLYMEVPSEANRKYKYSKLSPGAWVEEDTKEAGQRQSCQLLISGT